MGKDIMTTFVGQELLRVFLDQNYIYLCAIYSLALAANELDILSKCILLG